ncbi:MAG: transcription-repair coupling factor [Bryobacter sp.]|nr:transcription-repair coupling factor [Bryobacter sp.]
MSATPNSLLPNILAALAESPAFQELLAKSAPGQSISAGGLTLAAKALLAALLARDASQHVVVVTDGNKQAEAWIGAAETFADIFANSSGNAGHVQLLPSLDVLPHQRLQPHSQILEQRATGLWRTVMRRANLHIVPVASLLSRVAAPSFYKQLVLTLATGEEVPLEELAAHLNRIGYTPQEPVERIGQYSIRGGIVDIFPAEEEQPLRLEFFGDAIESIRRFDVATQRSVSRLKEARILPLVETPLDTDAPRDHNFLQLAAGGILLWDEPERIAGAAERLWKRLEDGFAEVKTQSDAPRLDPALHYFHWEDLASHGRAQYREIELRELGLETGGRSVTFSSRPSISFRGNIRLAVDEARNLVASGSLAVFFASTLGEVERFADVFSEYKVPFQIALPAQEAIPTYLESNPYRTATAGVFLVKGRLHRGVVFREPPLALFGVADLFESSGEGTRGSVGPLPTMGAFAADIADLKPNDLVVHQTHGVARFLGIKTIQQGDSSGEFLLLEYAGEAKLYVPVTRLDLITKYRGAGETKSSLDKLGGASWSKTKARVRARVRDMADELLKLYAERRMAKGFAFSPDSNWQREFEDAFEYSPTKDQVSAVRDIKRDMESDMPMDRLVVGDVGFGKTEVAMRAVFKALGDGKQVAVLAPTTVLAFQHYESFKRRFAAFPVSIDHLSRFRNPKETKQVLADLEAGKIDVLIGTHRILSKDVNFPDLGLLVVDEEQRFGVRHKERLKQIKKNVDVLTLSATPIPRTLHMSLAGIRDLSVIESPPKDRLAVHTVVANFDDEIVKQAIEQELSRGGQVYFIHNRVETIYMRASSIQALVPNIRLGVGHGQMNEDALETVLLGFMHGDFDVFVSTTIVENGLDIPKANTIIIEDAQNYGLSELYQLRGRVGRSNRRAYAYLLVPPGKELKEEARKRLAALKEFSDLGAGFKIAALDLEMRGAGDLLSGEQSGHINLVGFDMYIKLLEEAVQELRGEEVPLEIQSTISLGFEIRIPAEYIPEDNQRLRAYKRIADAKSPEIAHEIVAEFSDRYGPLPAEVHWLVSFGQIKNLAQRLGVEYIERRQGFFQIKFVPEARVDPARLMQLVKTSPGASFSPTGILRAVNTTGKPPGEILAALEELLVAIADPGAIASLLSKA